MNRIIIATYLILTVFTEASGQYSTDSKRAIAKFEMARRNYQMHDYQRAIENLLAATQIDDSFQEAFLLLGQVYTDDNQIEASINAFKEAVRIDPAAYPRVYFFLAENQISMGRYAEARKNLQLFLRTGQASGTLADRCRQNMENCDFALRALEHPVPFDPVNMGPEINSVHDEYFPSLSADGRMLVFTILLPVDGGNPQLSGYRQEDFYYSTRENDEWTLARTVGPPLNTPDNEGAQTLSADGKTMIFTACNRQDGYGLCDLYISEDMGEYWSEPVNMGEVINSAYSEKQPSLSSDGRVLYFTCDRPEGSGSYDIWYSSRSDDRTWHKPVNLGDSINTPHTDQSPFIHPDNKTLYFSSDGWPGMGGYDLFVSRRITGGGWTRPVNLGYPINTHHREEGLIVNASGSKAYYSSDRLEGRGRDLYEFDLYQAVRPVPVSYMKGIVYDAKTGQKLQASFELIDLGTGNMVMKATSRPRSGEFLVCIPADADYALNCSRQGYLFYSDNFSLDRVYGRAEPFYMDVPLQPIEAGQKTILRNVFFDHDSYVLKERSRVELDKVIDFLKANPSLKAEISGHTDNTGTEEYNQQLSEKRAAGVVNYLLEHQVDASQLTYRGYGMSQPVGDNATGEGRAANRRTELKILSR